jgi:hypothetical protein
MAFEFDERDKQDIETTIFTAIGAASTCWESLWEAGVFDSDRAKEIGDALHTEFQAYVRQHEVAARQAMEQATHYRALWEMEKASHLPTASRV